DIAEGQADWLPYLKEFYFGPDGLEQQVARGETSIDPREASTVRLEGLPGPVRIGRFGPFVEVRQNGETITVSLPEKVAPADLSEEEVERLVRAKASGPD